MNTLVPSPKHQPPPLRRSPNSFGRISHLAFQTPIPSTTSINIIPTNSLPVPHDVKLQPTQSDAAEASQRRSQILLPVAFVGAVAGLASLAVDGQANRDQAGRSHAPHSNDEHKSVDRAKQNLRHAHADMTMVAFS